MLTRVGSLGAVLACTVAGFGLAVPAEAQYQAPPRDVTTPRNALWGELGFYSGGSRAPAGPASGAIDVVLLSPVLGGFFEVMPHLEVGVGWGVSHASTTVTASGLGGSASESDNALMVGNPLLELLYRHDAGLFTLRVGGGLTIPVASLGPEDGVDEVIALAYASAIRGRWNEWMWAADRFTLALPSVRLDSAPGELLWALEADLGILTDTGDADRNTLVVLQTAAEAGVRPVGDFSLGGRVQLVWLAAGANDEEDRTQVAFEPFVRFGDGSAFVEARFTINVDEPFGFAFDEGKVWGLHASAGARF